jgi:hypothetical protein
MFGNEHAGVQRCGCICGSGVVIALVAAAMSRDHEADGKLRTLVL